MDYALENNYYGVVKPSLETLATEVSGYRRKGWRLHGFMVQDHITGHFIQIVERDPPRLATSLMEAWEQEVTQSEPAEK